MSGAPPTRSLEPPSPAGLENDKVTAWHDLTVRETDRSLLSMDLASDYSKADKSFDGARNITTLSVPLYAGQIRSASPDALSICSAGEFESLRTGRSFSRGGVPNASQSPAQSSPWRGKLEAGWVRNKGVVMVIVSQIFGTTMNVLTRMLELGGNNGKGMNPFQVHILTFKPKT